MGLRGYKKKTRPAPWVAARRGKVITAGKASKPAKTNPERGAGHSRKWVKPRSDLRRLQNRIYLLKRAEFLTMKPDCCGCPAALAANRNLNPQAHAATEIHHMRGRAGSLLLDTRYWVGVCREVHEWIGANPAKARAAGLLCEKGKWGAR